MIYGAINAPFRWQPAPSALEPDGIKILDDWTRQNLASFACEELSRWTGGKSRIVTMNESVKDAFLSLWGSWERKGLLLKLPASWGGWGGAWNARYKRGVPHDGDLRHVSNHATGHAFDICAQRYALGAAVPAGDPMRELAAVAHDLGWVWGGTFSRIDGMHFQYRTSPFP